MAGSRPHSLDNTNGVPSAKATQETLDVFLYQGLKDNAAEIALAFSRQCATLESVRDNMMDGYVHVEPSVPHKRRSQSEQDYLFRQADQACRDRVSEVTCQRKAARAVRDKIKSKGKGHAASYAGNAASVLVGETIVKGVGSLLGLVAGATVRKNGEDTATSKTEERVNEEATRRLDATDRKVSKTEEPSDVALKVKRMKQVLQHFAKDAPTYVFQIGRHLNQSAKAFAVPKSARAKYIPEGLSDFVPRGGRDRGDRPRYFGNCDEMHEFTRDFYLFYHHYHKARTYLQPLAKGLVLMMHHSEKMLSDWTANAGLHHLDIIYT